MQNFFSKIADFASSIDFKPILEPSNKVVLDNKILHVTQMLGSCTYKHAQRVIHDCRVIFLNYEQMGPQLLKPSQNVILELFGITKVLFKENIYGIHTHIQFPLDYPKNPPLIRIRNNDPSKFKVNDKFVNGLEGNNVFVVMSQHIKGVREWEPKSKLLDLVFQLQELLSNDFPFFLRSQQNVPNRPSSVSSPQYNQQQGNQSQQGYQQQQNLPHQAYTNNQPQQQQQAYQPNQYQQQQYQNQQTDEQYQQAQNQQQNQSGWNNFQPSQKTKMQEEQSGGTKKIQEGKQGIIQSVFALIPFTNQHKQAELKKEAENLQQRTAAEMSKKSQTITDEIKNQKAYSDKFIAIHSQQIIASSDLCQLEKNLELDMQEAGSQTYQCQDYLQQNDNKRLDLQFAEQQVTMDAQGQQIVNLMADVSAMRESLHFMVQKFKNGEGDINIIMKTTRTLSESIYDTQLLLRKCVMMSQQ